METEVKNLSENQKLTLYRSILAEIRLASFEFPNVKDLEPQEFHPISFDELYERRRDLQAFRLRLTRDPFLQEMYEENLKLLEDLKEQAKFYLFEMEVMHFLDLEPTRTTLMTNLYRYDVPMGILHLVVWHESTTTDIEIAHYLTKVFRQNNIGEKEFVLFKNPPQAQSVETIDHFHVFVPFREGLRIRFEDFC